MTDPNVKIEEISAETLEILQSSADTLVVTMRSIVEPKPPGMGEDQYDALVQHTIVGNAIVRILIAVSEKVGPLDMGAVRNGAFQALSYVSSVAQPVTDPNPGVEPNVN